MGHVLQNTHHDTQTHFPQAWDKKFKVTHTLKTTHTKKRNSFSDFSLQKCLVHLHSCFLISTKRYNTMLPPITSSLQISKLCTPSGWHIVSLSSRQQISEHKRKVQVQRRRQGGVLSVRDIDQHRRTESKLRSDLSLLP